MLRALGDAVVTSINVGQFVTPATAVRRFIAVRDESKLPSFPAKPPLVAVVPIVDPETVAGVQSPTFQGEYEVDLTIYAYVGKGDAAEGLCDTLMELRQQLRDLFKGVPLAVSGARNSMAMLNGIAGDLAFLEDKLFNIGLFVSPQTLKFGLRA
jgi:hypothetical protein